MRTVLIFGTFDGLHPGHIDCLRQAKKLGDRLVVSLTHDSVVKLLKKKHPEHSFNERKCALADSQLVDEIIEGDKKLGDFGPINKIKPDIIAIGYDQIALENALANWAKKHNAKFNIVKVRPYKPEEFKSSKLRKSV